MADDFSSLFEFLPIGAYRSSPQGEQLRANPALARLNGFASEAEQLAAKPDICGQWYVQPGRRAEFMQAMEQHGQVVGFESEICRYKTRERIWISENAHVVRDAQGRVLFYEGTVEEITDRVAARDALRASQEQLRQIIELVPGMVYRVVILPGEQRRATFASSGTRDLLGIEPEEVLRDGLLMHRLRHPDDAERIRAEARAATEAGLPLHTEYRIVLPGGGQKWVKVLSASAPPEDGHPVRVGMVLDVTAERQAQTLREERDRAAAADLAKSQFLSRVSHELRTPLNAVLGFAQLLEIDPGAAVGERQRAWVQQVLSSGRHLLSLVDDILDLASAQTGQLSVEAQAQAVDPLVQEAVAMMSRAALTAGVSVHCDVDGQARLAVRADGKRVKQILSNLLSNAIKYNRRGGWVRVAARGADGAVEFSVADSGPGLSAAQCARLFQPFERAGAQFGPVAGTGLGLALSRQLAEAMGGSITVDSQPGQGAVFRLRLPAG